MKDMILTIRTKDSDSAGCVYTLGNVMLGDLVLL